VNNNSIIRKELKKNKGVMSGVVFLGLMSVISGAALMYVSGYLISKASLQIGNILMLQVPTVLTRTFSLAQSTFAYIQRLVSHNLVLGIIEKMRSRVYKILEPKALKLKKEYKSGDLLGIISEDIEVIYNCKRIRFSLECTNLSNNQTYLNSAQSGLSSYITQYGIRGRSVLMKMRFKIL